MPDRSKVRFQTKHGDLRRAPMVEVRFRDASAWLCKWTRDSGTPEEDPTSLQKAKLESAHWEGPREPFKIKKKFFLFHMGPHGHL